MAPTTTAESNIEMKDECHVSSFLEVLNDKKSTEKKSETPQKKEVSAMNLSSFFKPMCPEDKEKAVLNELEKVKQEI